MSLTIPRAAEGSPYDIDPPFTWDAPEETRLLEILAWVENAPKYRNHIVIRCHYDQVASEIHHLLLRPRLDDMDRRKRSLNFALTTDRECAKQTVEICFPGFWQTSGLCGLSGHASIGPDFNDPHKEALLADWSEDEHHAGFDADLTPGDSHARECLAILSCVIQAELARRKLPLERRPPKFDQHQFD